MRMSPLAHRCLALCFSELELGVRANPKPQPNTGPQVKEYFAGCVRDTGGGFDRKLGLTAGNWCMASQSWILDQCWKPGDLRPHKWRAAVIEAERDAKEQGLWLPAGPDAKPTPGDLAVWSRGDPKSWTRHVNRVVAWHDDRTFTTIGGNEGRAWRHAATQPKAHDDPRLLGFIRYSLPSSMPNATADTEPPLLSDEEKERLGGLIALSLAEITRNLGRGS